MKSLNGAQLKRIAILSMVMDHFTKGVLFDYFDHPLWKTIGEVFLVLGRMAFPIFCFLLVEGFIHTSNRGKFITNLLIFALISEIPFDLFLTAEWNNSAYQNILWTFIIAVIMLMLVEHVQNYASWWGDLLTVLIVGVGAWIAYYFNTDYRHFGVILIFLLYQFRSYTSLKLLLGSLLRINSPYSILGFSLCYFYNGERGKQNKWLGYFFYPTHLLVIYLLSHYLHF